MFSLLDGDMLLLVTVFSRRRLRIVIIVLTDLFDSQPRQYTHSRD